ncbi:MAG: FecR domain-containing protein [Gammaproteobacteria bacterium]
MEHLAWQPRAKRRVRRWALLILKCAFSVVCAFLLSVQKSAVDQGGRQIVATISTPRAATAAESIYSTTLGEHKSVAMTDGSELLLNTSSQASVQINARSRAVALRHGEVLLSVATDPRPFVVHLDSIDFETTGTARAHLRLDPDGTTRVDMLEGDGWVRPAGAANAAGASDAVGAAGAVDAAGASDAVGAAGAVDAAGASDAVGAAAAVDAAGASDAVGTAGAAGPAGAAGRAARVLSRFQPLQVKAGSSFSLRYDVRIVERLDPAETDRRLAWTQGQVVLAGEALRDAVAEFNRYNRMQLVVGDDSIGSLPTGGAFYTTEIDTFTRSLNRLFGIRAVRTRPSGNAAAADVVMLVGADYSGM